MVKTLVCECEHWSLDPKSSQSSNAVLRSKPERTAWWLLNSSIVQGKTHYSERKAEIGMIEGEIEGRGGRKKAGLHSIVCCYTAMKTKSSQETRGLERCFHQPGGRKTNPGSICVLLYSRQWPFLEGFCFQGLPRKLQY